MKMVDGEKQAFPLPGCTDIVVRLCSGFSRYELTHTIDAKEDNVLLARVEGDEVPLGEYALEVPTSAAELTMQPNRMYAISIGDTLTISLAEPTDKTVTNEWQGSFDVGETVPTVTWPENVTWAFAPSIEANCHYEFSIRYVGGKYYGIVYGWAL